ncbi:MAG: hypothetical protein IIC51_08480 [Planctomycetes bacterium]|nr:hypothetical protein [Planctomycetota bacterium]
MDQGDRYHPSVLDFLGFRKFRPPLSGFRVVVLAQLGGGCQSLLYGWLFLRLIRFINLQPLPLAFGVDSKNRGVGWHRLGIKH